MYGDAAKVLRFALLLYYIITITTRVLFIEYFDLYSADAALVFDYLVDFFYFIDTVIFNTPGKTNLVHPTKSQHQLLSTSIHRNSLVVSRNPNFIKHPRKNLRAALTYAENMVQYMSYAANIGLLFPFEIVGFVAGMRAYYSLRLLRLFRCYFFGLYWKDVAEILEKKRIAVSAGAQRVVVFAIIFALTCHVFACGFYAVGLEVMKAHNYDNWLYIDGLVSISEQDGSVVVHESLSYRYLRAVYWSVQTITTIGFGDLTPHSESETWFCIFYFFVIALLVSFTLANLTMAISNFDAAQTDNLLKTTKFEKYASYRHLPKELTNRVLAYYAHQWKRLHGVDELQVFLVLFFLSCLFFAF
jgi:hypothetical protein